MGAIAGHQGLASVKFCIRKEGEVRENVEAALDGGEARVKPTLTHRKKIEDWSTKTDKSE